MMTVPILLASLLVSASSWTFETKEHRVEVRPETARTYAAESEGTRWVQRDAVILITKKGEARTGALRTAVVGCEEGRGLIFYVDEGGIPTKETKIDDWGQNGGRYIDVMAMMVCSAAFDKEMSKPSPKKPALPRGGTMI